ncbi:MAG: sugar transferase [Bacteroidota bacterium]
MYSLVKRIFDIAFSLAAILLILPFMIPIVLGLLLTGEHYVFYFQKRIGYKNRMFYIWKFATMLKNSPKLAGGIITTTGDPRILPMGHFLRKTKINELPQFINVLKGDMSFVGPRPLMKEASFDLYPPDVQAVVYNVRPGITGIGSIIFRNEEELMTQVKEEGGDPKYYYEKVILPYKGRVEKWYQANQSFLLDFSILVCTVLVIVFPEANFLPKLYPDIPKEDLRGLIFESKSEQLATAQEV